MKMEDGRYAMRMVEGWWGVNSLEKSHIEHSTDEEDVKNLLAEKLEGNRRKKKRKKSITWRHIRAQHCPQGPEGGEVKKLQRGRKKKPSRIEGSQ